MNIIIDRTWKQGSLVNIEDLRGMTFKAEAQAHTFRISGVDAAGNPITLTGTPSGVMLRPDNTDVALTCAVSDGKVTATLPAECYDVPGRVGITIYLTSNSQKVCIYSAITSVNRTSSGTASPGTTSSVVDLVNAIEAAIAQIPASDTNLKGALAPTYSDSAVYAVGQYAWYDGKLYKCTTAITTSESWTSGHWTEAKLAQDVTGLKSALDQLDGTSLYTNLFNKVTALVATDVNTSTGELKSGTATLVTSDFIKISDPTKTLKASNLQNGKYFFVYDSGKTYLGYGAFNSSTEATVSTNYPTAAYIRIQTTTAKLDSCYLMYAENWSSTYIPYNPVDGNIANSQYLAKKIAEINALFTDIRQRLRFGYFFNKGYLEIDTTASPVTYKIKGNSYVLADDGYGKNTGIAVDTAYTLTGFKTAYCTIVYSITNNDFRCLQDYTGDYSDYVIFGFYMKGYVYGNLGMVLVNGSVSNPEIEKALSELDIDVSALQAQVEEDATAIGTNAASIASEATARELADTALGARIDNLVAPSGSSVAEITDARVGYDGTIYASLEARLKAEAGRVRNVLVVGSGGQYQTIAAAVAAAQNGDIVYIKRGVYEEKVSNADKVVHIVGESKEEVIWKYPNTDYNDNDVYKCGMGSIRNLTMWNYDNGETPSGSLGRSYCLHIDNQSHYQSDPPISNYWFCENVHFINDSNECVGLGLRPNMTAEFVNCDFETLIAGNEAAFYVHSTNRTDMANAKLILNGCKIRNNSSTGQKGALRIECYNKGTQTCTAILMRNIIVNLGTGPDVILQKSGSTQADWSTMPDWKLDKCSLLNNASLANYSAS